MPSPHLSLASRARAGIPCRSQALAPCHRAEVCPPADQAALRDRVVHYQGFAHGALRGPRVEAAGRGLNQTVQVVHLDGVVGKTLICAQTIVCLSLSGSFLSI